MTLTRRKLYIIMALALVSGYAWLLYDLVISKNPDDSGLCIFRHITSLPCPSCGSTRSVVSFLHGNIHEALTTNPLGIVIAAIMISLPLWLAYDLTSGKRTLFDFYIKMELRLRKPSVAIPLICLVMANWIWNIFKGL